MKGKGIAGFVGARLREAREARQMTAVALAEITSLTSAGISSYENGRYHPTADVLDQLCAALNMKPEFFFRPSGPDATDVCNAVFERSRTSATKSARRRARHRQTWIRETVQHLETFVAIPAHNIPDIGYKDKWRTWGDAEIEDMATEARRYWKLGDGPISDMTLLVENQGVVVALMDMGTNKLDAFSRWDHVDRHPYIILGQNGQSKYRTRFNVCHELGHLVLHKHVLEPVFQDRRHFKQLENQADRFAAAFLTPATTFAPDINTPSLEVFRMLKRKWQTSIKMMIHRAQDLSIIDREEARRLYVLYSRRRWNSAEPYDDDPVEEPRLLRRMFEMIIENSIIDRQQISAALPFKREGDRTAHQPPTRVFGRGFRLQLGHQRIECGIRILVELA